MGVTTGWIFGHFSVVVTTGWIFWTFFGRRENRIDGFPVCQRDRSHRINHWRKMTRRLSGLAGLCYNDIVIKFPLKVQEKRMLFVYFIGGFSFAIPLMANKKG